MNLEIDYDLAERSSWLRVVVESSSGEQTARDCLAKQKCSGSGSGLFGFKFGAKWHKKQHTALNGHASLLRVFKRQQWSATNMEKMTFTLFNFKFQE